MAIDPFKNAKPYYDPTFPSSGDGFSIAGVKNALQGLGFMDFLPLQPRAHNPANASIMIRGRDASSYFNPIYAGDSDKHIFFASGDTPNFSTPSINPRIDIVYLTASGDIKIMQGTEAVSPGLPSLSPSGDSRTPICAVFLKKTMNKVVNFEDKDSNSGDGYIYQDLRPFIRTPGAGAATLGSTLPTSPTGDAQITAGVASTAAKVDHRHSGVHAVRVVGQTNLQGDIEFAGHFTQAGNRITATPATQAQMEAAADNVAFVSPISAKWHPGVAKFWCFFDGTTTGTFVPTASHNVASVTRNSAGLYTINLIVAFSSTNYAVIGCAGTSGVAENATFQPYANNTTTCQVSVTSGGAGVDRNMVMVSGYGDQ